MGRRKSVWSDPENILVLHGEWRMGKTSILLHLEKGRLGKPLRERKDRPLYPVFVNLQNAPDGTEHFLHRISTLTSECLRRHPVMQVEIPAPAVTDFAREPYTCFDQYMQRVNESLGAGLLVLMFDEFEALDRWVAEKRVDAGIYGVIRHQMQFLRNVGFILAGSHQLGELSPDYQSVLRVALQREVGFMDEAAALELVQEPVHGQVVYEQGVIEELLRMTNRHPYLLQLLCHRLINMMNQRATTNRVSQDDVAAAIDYIVSEGAPHLNYVWERSPWMEKEVLSLLADRNATQPCTHTDLVKHLGFSDAQVTVAAQSLVRRRLIEEVGNGAVEPTEGIGQAYHWLLSGYGPSIPGKRITVEELHPAGVNSSRKKR